MRTPLVHGCYDIDTLRTLKEKGIRHFGFDLRGRSPNLIPFHQLSDMLKGLTTERVHLIFENDRPATINSFLSLLASSEMKFELEFRDELTPDYYDSFGKPFFWMFSPQANWMEILRCRNLKGILLPTFYQAFYQTHPEFWDLIDRRRLEVFVHGVNFSEVLKIQKDQDSQLSVDLTREMEKGFRTIDQDLLKRQIAEIS